MKAMIFAAGLGTRLRPLTNDKPKALIEVAGIPLLEIAIRRLKYFGFRQIIVNVHHFADQIEQFLQKKDSFQIEISISDERDQLLDTGGGLRKAAPFFDDGKPFLIYNADIITDLDLTAFYQHHLNSGALATLAVQDRISTRKLLFDDHLVLSGWENQTSGDIRWCHPESDISLKNTFRYAFSGIHVADPAIFAYMPDKDAFSIIELYLSVGAKQKIMAYPHTSDLLLDVGKPESIGIAASVSGRITLA